MLLLLDPLLPPPGLDVLDTCYARDLATCRHVPKYRSPSQARQDSARIAVLISAKMMPRESGDSVCPTCCEAIDAQSFLDDDQVAAGQGSQNSEPNPANLVGGSTHVTAMRFASSSNEGYLGDDERSSASSFNGSSSDGSIEWRREVTQLLHKITTKARGSHGSLAGHMARLEQTVAAHWPSRPRSLFPLPSPRHISQNISHVANSCQIGFQTSCGFRSHLV